jgi:hypothetical protein
MPSIRSSQSSASLPPGSRVVSASGERGDRTPFRRVGSDPLNWAPCLPSRFLVSNLAMVIPNPPTVSPWATPMVSHRLLRCQDCPIHLIDSFGEELECPELDCRTPIRPQGPHWTRLIDITRGSTGLSGRPRSPSHVSYRPDHTSCM